jgi:hypothetical protein
MRNQHPWIPALAAALTLALATDCKKDESAAPAPSSDTAKQPGVKSDPAQGNGSAGDWRNRRAGRMGRDGDGAVSEEERAARMKASAEMMRKRLDTDGDGKLTPAELANAPGRMKFDDPAALDTNHDGDISTDELLAAMKARAEQRRAQRAGSGAAGSAGSADGSGADGAGGW